MQDAIYALCEYIHRTQYDDLPATAITATKYQILDTYAGALPALHADGIAQLLALARTSGGHAQASVWGSTERLPVEQSARINAAMAHALEFDDTYERALLHASVVTVPAALGMAEYLGDVSGQQLITAVALGTDLACRLARAGSPGKSPFIVGWDPTPMFGYFAAAATAGKLLQLQPDQLASAMGLVYHQAAGNAQASIQGTHAKRMGPGNAVYAGIQAARLAQQGVQAACDALEGIKGFYKQYHQGHYDRQELLADLGQHFAGVDIAPKPYPSCRGGHCAIDAALQWRAALGGDLSQIDSILIECAPAEMMLLGAPRDKKINPQNSIDAQFSFFWVVAAALVDGAVDLSHFSTAALQRNDLRQWMQKMQIREDTSLVRSDGGPGAVRLTLIDPQGRTQSKQVNVAKGDRDNPFSHEEYLHKFQHCCNTAGMADSSAARILQHWLQLEHIDRIADHFTL